MNMIGRKLALGLVTATALSLVPAARAGVDVSFGANIPVGDNGQLFFSISSQYYNRPLPVVDDWGRRFADPDDLAVFLHLCSHSRSAPDVVFSYRKQGMSWYDVGVRIGVPLDTWYVPVQADPGPPYGKAYGYRRKHERDPHYKVRLSDRQCRDLVAVRMAHDYYGVSPQVAMDWRRNGTRIDVIMSREYRARHEGGSHGKRGRAGQDDDDHGHGSSHGRGHDKHGSHGNE